MLAGEKWCRSSVQGDRHMSNLLKYDPAPWRNCGFCLLVQFFVKRERSWCMCVSI